MNIQNDVCPLSALREGERGELFEIEEAHPLYTRLIELGWTKGTVVQCVRESPLGDPVAYESGGSVIALRQRDSQAIRVRRVSEKGIVSKPKIQERREAVLALAGNPNVGKSTLFNSLTGLHQHTGNWTGKTVNCAEGQFTYQGQVFRVIDLPGTYSLSPRAGEEEVACDFLCGGQADAIGVVCDAGALSRNLILVLQLMTRTDKPLAVILNLSREAQRRGRAVDSARLSSLLGIPVIVHEARDGKTHALMQGLYHLVNSAEQEKDADEKTSTTRLLTMQSEPLSPHGLATLAARVAEECTTHLAQGDDSRDRRLDRILTGKITGSLAMLALLALLLWITMAGANVISDWLMGLFQRTELALAQLARTLGVPWWLYEPLLYGVFRTVGWVVSVMLPPMAIFFPLFTLLEDFGYLPRLCFNMDRCFANCHASGKQAMTMCMGLGCNAVGVTGSRIIDSPRERRIAMLTNAFIPCNGRFPTLIALIGMFLATGTGVWGSWGAALILTGALVLCVLVTLLASRLLSVTLLRGQPQPFVLDLPPYRVPRVGQLIVRSLLDRTLHVLGRAVAVAAPAGLILWLLANCPWVEGTLLGAIAAAVDPVGRALGMDGVILIAFVLALPANEIFLPIMLMIYRAGSVIEPLCGMDGVRDILLSNGWSVQTAVCVMLFLLFHFPCATTLLTIRREGGGWRWAVVGALIPTCVGALCCLAVHGLFLLLGR